MYYVKKILISVATILVISIVVFFMFQVIPGNPVLTQLGIEGMQDELLVEKLTAEFQLNKPLVQRYTDWVINICKGNLGSSFKYKKGVSDLIAVRLVPTLTLSLLSMFVIVVLAIPLGIFIAKNKGNKIGTIFSVSSQIFLALPGFWLAILLMWLFSFKLGLFPTRVTVDLARPLETLKNLFMPVLSLSLGSIALVVRYVHTSVSQQEGKEYITVLKAKGLTDRDVMNKHVLKNSLIPVITILGLIFVSLLTGSIIIENVYTIQGIGTLLISSIKDNDYPLVQGIVLYYSVVVVAVSFILDLAYSVIDPRIRSERSRP